MAGIEIGPAAFAERLHPAPVCDFGRGELKNRLRLPLLSLCAASVLQLYPTALLLPLQPVDFYHFLLAPDQKRLVGW